jgi:hypothetical protein
MSHSIISKFQNLRSIIKDNGGIFKSFLTLYRTDDLKQGTLIGVDRNGNKYYQNTRYFVGEFLYFFVFVSYDLINECFYF